MMHALVRSGKGEEQPEQEQLGLFLTEEPWQHYGAAAVALSASVWYLKGEAAVGDGMGWTR